MDDKHKYFWVHQTSTLLDYQHIEWSFFRSEEFKYNIKNINYQDFSDRIYIKVNPTITSSVTLFLNKGDIKWKSNEINGNVELALYSIISAKLSKFVGLIKVDFASNFIAGMSVLYTEKDIEDLPKELMSKIEKHK